LAQQTPHWESFASLGELKVLGIGSVSRTHMRKAVISAKGASSEGDSAERNFKKIAITKPRSLIK
jgi:hypothetical protein